jgi:hypothetical protein
MWKDADESTRVGWSDYAGTLEFEGPMGTYHVSGRSVFIGNLGLALFINSISPGILPVISDDPPEVAGFLTPSHLYSIPLDEVGTGIMTFVSWVSDEPAILWSQRSFAFNATRNRFKGPYLSSSNQGLSMAAPGGYRQSFLDLSEDRIYFTKHRIISAQAPFRTSVKYFLRHVATTFAE